jgi:hypothetical protein
MGDFREIFFLIWLKCIMKNCLLKNVTFYSLNTKLKLKMHSMNVFCAIMGYTEKHKDITEAIRDAKGGHDEVLEPHGGLQGHPRVPRERACHRGFFKGNSGLHRQKMVFT